MPAPLRLLIVEDSADDAKLLLMKLRDVGKELFHRIVETAEAMSEALVCAPWDIIISDYSLPQFSGLAALALLRATGLDIPFILVSGTVGEETAVEAMKAGANDYLFKGNLKRLVPAVQRELREADERRAARHSEGRYRTLFEYAPDGILIADAKSNYLDANPSICRMLGYTHDELVGLEASDIVAEAEVPYIAQALDVIYAKADYRREWQFKHKDGSFIAAEVLAAIMPDGNLMAMVRDITEHKRVDGELAKARDAAEAANHAKSEFLANMSHEIRTPMSAIIGFADMMLQNNPNGPDHVECAKAIRRNGGHLLELINEILDLSKIDAGQMATDRVRCDLPQLLAEVAQLMRSRATERSLKFKVSFSGSIPRYVCTDPLRLRQILVNLLGNAIKFTTNGSVELRICCDKTAQTSALWINVRDTGIGMNTEQLGRIFEPFTQGEQSTTRKFGGTGLGLTISRRLARLLGGDISVTSEEGAGSDFGFWIDGGPLDDVDMLADLTEAKLPEIVTDDPAAEIPIRGRILLVEDGRDNQRLFSTHLQMAGAEVKIAENGKVAVDLFDTEAFDLILMDMQMPVMDGYSAVKELRRRGITVPIIALTAYAMSEDRAKCMGIGCTDYLTKPVDRQVLLQTIGFYLGQSDAPVAQLYEPKGRSEPCGSIKSTMTHFRGMAKIIDEFVAGLPEQVRKLEMFLEQGETDSARRVVHQLRGACGGYGFGSITELAATAEDALKEGQSGSALKAKIDSLTRTIGRIEGFNVRSEKLAA